MARFGFGFGVRLASIRALPEWVPPPTPEMPADAAMLVYSADASSTSPLVKNRAAGTEVPANLVGTARVMDNPNLVTLTNNVTRTPSQPGPDGALKAVRFQYTSGASPLGRILQRDLPPGNYTLQMDIKDISGSGGVIRFAELPGATSGPNMTVGSAYARYSVPLTLTVERLQSLAITCGSAGAPFDVSVDNAVIVRGSSPIEPEATVNPHLVAAPAIIGPNKNGDLIEATGTTLTAMRMALGVPEAQRNAVSIVAAVRMDPNAVETNGTIFSILNEVESAGELNASKGLMLGQVSSYLRLSGANGVAASTMFAGAAKADWCVLIATAGDTGVDLWVNRLKVASSSTPYSGGTYSAIEVMGRALQANQQFLGKMAVIGMWHRKLSDAEVAAAYQAAVAEVEARGEVFQDFGSVGIKEGDSISAGTGDDGNLGGYFARAGRLFTRRLQGLDYAVPGATLGFSPADDANDINAKNRKAAVDAKIAEVVALGKRPIFSVLIGANNAGTFNSDAQGYFALLKTYTDARKTLGAKIVVETMTDQSGFNATQRANIATFNQLLRDGVGSGYFDACVDHAATAMGTWSSTYFADGAHPNAAGHALMAATWRAAVAPLVTS